MFSVILGVVSVTANPSSLYRPILSPNLVCSCDNRKPPTSSHVLAPSKLPMVTSKVLELFFCHCCCLLVRSEFFAWMMMFLSSAVIFSYIEAKSSALFRRS